MAEFLNLDAYGEWLHDKPPEWAQALAIRSALRVLPIALDLSGYRGPRSQELLRAGVLRAVLVSWSAATVYGYSTSRDAAIRALVSAEASADVAAYAPAFAAARAAAATFSSDLIGARAAAASAVADAAASAARNANGRDSFAVIWEILRSDASFLEQSSEDAGTAARSLLGSPLWAEEKTPASLVKSWGRPALDADNMSFWRDWYQRRLAGRVAGFALPVGQDRLIGERILSQPDEWWERGLFEFTRDLAGWIEEAAISAGVATVAATQDLDSVMPVPQSPAAPQFGTNASGQLSIDFSKGANELRIDRDARDRHAEALRLAQHLAVLCTGSNSLGHLKGVVDGYIEAIGGKVEDMRPSLLVQRGERLRRFISIYETLEPHSLYQQVDEFEFEALQALRDAHNSVVGLDGFLDGLDRARLGPDQRSQLVAPAELQSAVGQLARRAVIDADAQSFIADAIELAPIAPDLESRQSRQVDGIAQNLMRYAVEFIVTYPQESAWVTAFSGVSVMVLLGPFAALAGVAGSIATAYHLGRNILANKDFYRSAAGSSPANRENFERVVAFLEGLPLQSLRDQRDD